MTHVVDAARPAVPTAGPGAPEAGTGEPVIWISQAATITGADDTVPEFPRGSELRGTAVVRVSANDITVTLNPGERGDDGFLVMASRAEVEVASVGRKGLFARRPGRIVLTDRHWVVGLGCVGRLTPSGATLQGNMERELLGELTRVARV